MYLSRLKLTFLEKKRKKKDYFLVVRDNFQPLRCRCIKNKPFSFKIERPDDPRSLKEKVKDRLKKRFGGKKQEQDG